MLNRMARILIFASVAFSIMFGLHYYVWARLVRDTGLSHPWRTVATAAIVLLGASMPLAFIVGRSLSRSAARWVVWPAYLWMGLLFFLFTLLVASDVARVGLYAIERARRLPPMDPERRVALARLFGGAVALIATGLGALAVRTGIARAIVRELEVKLDRLPRALDGLSIVQLTDIHVGPTIGREFIEDLVAQANALKPDLVAITGDLVDGSVESLRDQVAPLAQLKARHGVYFVTGNHEYYSGVGDWIDELGRLGVRVLRNERVAIAGENGEGFDLAGVDDHSSRGLAPGHGPDLERALDGRDPARECVLLAHQPRAIHEAARLGVGLQLSGHTHGGQIWPWGYLVRLQQPYVVGFAREGRTQLYVSPGTGYWGPPMRLGTRSEITRIVLRAPA
jgi:predicted MPP superfamily phosphohydrolase